LTIRFAAAAADEGNLERRTGLLSQAFAVLGDVREFVLSGIACRVAAETRVGDATFGAVGHHFGLGDDDLFLPKGDDDGLADLEHHDAKDNDADVKDEGGQEW
jgi:hypothetical protein